ncbi:NfeD family protein [Paenibacillus sp. 1P07SE]|uniref:NfeD family protein n=1 Tax=Paenibacillus sp. 1P07SE TaxID=3132209 RepID=UPI0039A46A84
MFGLLAGIALPLLEAAEPADERPPASGPAVYVIPVKQTIESGLQSFLERAFQEAEEAEAERIILVINTFGGRVDSAAEIGDLIRNSSVPTVAFVESNAISAGAYIALNADQIVMLPNSSIGDAAVVDGATGELVDNPKITSLWTNKMKAAAEANGRDPAIAVKMVDPSATLTIEELDLTVGPGNILTLTSEEALAVGYAEHLASSVEETLEWLGLEERMVVEMELTTAENLARWLTSPLIRTLLLIVGMAGVAIEVIVPGFGAPGIIGIASFGLYFFAHYIAGFAGLESFVLFVVGIALLVLELFIPSFGILGFLGIGSLIAGVVTAAYDTGNAFYSLLIAFGVATVLVIIFAVIFKKKGIWNKFILRDSLSTEEGYIPAVSREDLLDMEGVTLTPLRPSGTVQIGEERIDVVTSGQFIANNKPIKVIKVEGTRVIVREIV